MLWNLPWRVNALPGLIEEQRLLGSLHFSCLHQRFDVLTYEAYTKGFQRFSNSPRTQPQSTTLCTC